MAVNICMIGHGMMGRWHSEALRGRDDCRLYTVVGRRDKPTAAFAAEFGYCKWTTKLEEGLSDDAVSIVIVASPSETHAAIALAALSHGKHTLVEVPIAMSLTDAERLVSVARERGLILGVVHPVRFVDEIMALHARTSAGEERVRQVVGRFYTHRLENVGATGYRRSWTDNILWHHTTHLLDCAMWLTEPTVTRVHGFMPGPDPKTGTPMDVAYLVETEANQSLVFVGSYYARVPQYDVMIVTDWDTYVVDIHRQILTTGEGPRPIHHEKVCNARVAQDFVLAVRDRREPFVSGESVLPTMAVVQQVQDQWDRVHGARSVPGRPH